jgi:hypothetical protein
MYRGLGHSFTGLCGMLEPGKNDKGLMSAIVGVSPAFANCRIKKVVKQIVRVERTRVLRFQRTSSLKFRETLEFIPR